MAHVSILEALETLRSSVPEWNDRLDELNGQIALRQIELARLTESERPPTRSLKNKGSTESLRPKDGNENPFLSHDLDNPDDIQLNPFDSPRSNQNGFTSNPRSKVAAGRTITPPKASSNPRPSPNALTRQSSQPNPLPQGRPTAQALRKRKTESLASNESLAPKYRTRSMIIVYYDSAVQTAFEELVKFVSASRNTMRKGIMAAKMAEMKRAAELEVGDDDDDDDGTDDLVPSRGTLVAAQKKISISRQGESLIPDGIAPVDSDSSHAADMAMPKLRFVSTRQMGPSRDAGVNKGFVSSALGPGLLRGYRRAGGDAPDIFDDLDKGLEWCQGQCEHAAHQFLRDGECSTEIANIKKKLAEVRQTAEKEIKKLKKEEAANPPPKPAEVPDERQFKTPFRRNLGSFNDLEVDDMEIDDVVDDLDPPKLFFKRSRDIGL